MANGDAYVLTAPPEMEKVNGKTCSWTCIPGLGKAIDNACNSTSSPDWEKANDIASELTSALDSGKVHGWENPQLEVEVESFELSLILHVPEMFPNHL